jgi:hypothetical protein
MSPTEQPLAARVDLLAIVVQELGRALSAAQAAQVAQAVLRRVDPLALLHPGTAADEALTAERAPLLAALG